MREWEQIVSPEEKEVYRRSGFGKKVGFGKKPALLVIDVQNDFTGYNPEPILESIAKFRRSCGEAAWVAIPYIQRLLELVRQKSIPVFYTHSFSRPEDMTDPQPRPRNGILYEISPLREDTVIEKAAASPFFGTRLVSKLIRLGIDTVMYTGCTTSGCVRAGVVDGAAYGFKNIVVEEAVFDRARIPHLISLFDMDQKYADVLSFDEVQNLLINS